MTHRLQKKNKAATSKALPMRQDGRDFSKDCPPASCLAGFTFKSHKKSSGYFQLTLFERLSVDHSNSLWLERANYTGMPPFTIAREFLNRNISVQNHSANHGSAYMSLCSDMRPDSTTR